MPGEIHEFPEAPARPRVKKLRLLLVLSGLGALALVSTAFGMMMAVASELPSLESAQEFKSARNSVLVDYKGRDLGILTGPENRVLVKSEEISRPVRDAIIAIEDKRFYENEGVDLQGIGRALVQDVLQRRIVQGGSTITQQFVKNKLEAQGERTVLQKLRESAMAFHLTRKWSKDKILTEYLNTIYFGNGAYGIESAARTYFGNSPVHRGCGVGSAPKCASRLRAVEAALLAAVVASPSGYDPVANPAAAEQRRNLVLLRMLEQGRIDRAEYARSIRTALPTARQITPPRERARTPQTPYFTTWIKQQVVERFGAREAFSGGLRVETTLDLDLQQAAEETVSRWLSNPEGPTAALVALDNETGEVRAMVGGRDFNASPFNLATQGRRQPGSAFKPFTLVTALEEGIGPGSLWSSRKKFLRRPGCDFEVNNYEDSYAGTTSLAGATTTSDNSVYAEVGLQVGLADVAKTARRLGVRTPISRNCAMTLGGLREGVTPLDMAHAYQTIATGGRFVTGSLADDRGPVGIREVSRRGAKKPLVENEREARRVIDEEVADQTKQILSTVVTSGTATLARLDEFAAGKTGTTENYGDAWFVGFTDRLTVAVWVGYPEGMRPMETEYRGLPVAGGTYPAEIWRDFMVAAETAIEERINADRARKGLPPLPDESAQPAPVEPVPAGAPAPVTPTAAPAPAAPAVPVTPPPEPEPEPAPAPTPAVPAPTASSGTTGTAAAGGTAASP